MLARSFLVAILLLSRPAFADEVESVGTELESDQPRWSQVSRFGRAVRAESQEQLEGDVSFVMNTPRPGSKTVEPDGTISGRLGLGAGFQAELFVTRSGGTGRVRPGVGVAYEIYSSPARGFQFATAVQYVPEGFTEAAGEIEAMLVTSLRKGQTELTFDLVGGVEAESFEKGEAEGDAEARLAIGQLLFGRLLIGAEGQSRFKIAEGFGRIHDHFGAAMLQASADAFVFTGLFGVGVRVTEEETTLGPYALARLEYRF